MTVSRFILNLALRHVPPGRAEWAQAMRSEFEVLEKGRLAWALGCLQASLGWCLTANVLYMLAIPACIIVTSHLIPGQFYFWMEARCPPFSNVYCRYSGYLWGNLPLLLACVGLGIWRPDRVVATAILITLCDIVFAYAFFLAFMHMPFGGYIHFMDLPPVAGETAVLLGAWLGAAAGRLVNLGGLRMMRTLKRR